MCSANMAVKGLNLPKIWTEQEISVLFTCIASNFFYNFYFIFYFNVWKACLNLPHGNSKTGRTKKCCVKYFCLTDFVFTALFCAMHFVCKRNPFCGKCLLSNCMQWSGLAISCNRKWKMFFVVVVVHFHFKQWQTFLFFVIMLLLLWGF